ncbi:Accumulation-associated protein [Labeo rohita]|uniref:Accumulation-associated protein n=1 Tax=Labeo rohita TaxID=84645 RepID=A0ABQ8LYM7_LABRO|nr:Accumulation-associated protein [Labeo rohita]
MGKPAVLRPWLFCILPCQHYLKGWTEHHHTSAALQGRSSREPRRLCGVGAGVLPVFTDCGLHGRCPSPDPEPSQPSCQFTEHKPELTTDGETEPITSDQVREPSTSHATVKVTVEREGAEESPAHCTIAESERKLNPGLWYFEQDLIDFNEGIYTLTLSPPSVRWAWRSSASFHRRCGWRIPLPPASGSWTASRPSDPAAPPRLLASSSPPWPIGPPASPGSLVPLAPPWSVIDPPSPQDSTPPAAPRRSVPPAPLGFSLPPAPPQSSDTLAPPWTSGSPPPPRSLSLGLRLGPPDPLCRLDSSALCLCLGLYLHLLRRRRSPPWNCQPCLHQTSTDIN